MESTDKLPPGWIKVKSKSHPGKTYFYNHKNKQAVWNLKDLMSPDLCSKMKGTPKKASDSTSLSNKSISINKKNLAESRMKNLRMALEKEKDEMTVSAAKSNKYKTVTSEKSKSPDKKIMPSSPRKRGLKKDSIISGKKLESPRKRADENEKLRSQTSVEKMDVDMVSQELVNNHPEDYVEPMEWEEIDIEEVVKEVNNIRSVKSIYSSLMPHHDATDDNINDDKFYVIVDTNIFISNPLFIERIKGKIYKDIGKACIYIPYIVLCELDLLKTREGNISKAAQRGIKTINAFFASKDPWIVGQSIKDDTRELIPIESGDDRILNCAFQLKEVTKKVLVLSNDINLRNKAFVNGFEVYSVDMLNYADFNTTNTIKFE